MRVRATAAQRCALAATAVLALLGASAPATGPLLVATHDQMSGADYLLFVRGDQRIPANAGPGSGGYGLLETLPDGTAIVSYTHSGFGEVEAIAPSLQTRPLKSFPLNAVGFVAPAVDGFVEYSQASQFLQRYDAQGRSQGGPIASLGVTSALGLASATVALSKTRITVYDRSGRARHAAAVETGAIAPLPGDRFAVTDLPNSWVRIYDTDLKQLAFFSFPGRALLALVSGSDGALGVLHGTLSCVGGAELDVFDDPIAGKLGARIYNVQGPRVSLALTPDTVYVANSGCMNNGDGTISVYNRDGTPRTTLRNVGTPSGILVLPNPTPPPR